MGAVVMVMAMTVYVYRHGLHERDLNAREACGREEVDDEPGKYRNTPLVSRYTGVSLISRGVSVYADAVRGVHGCSLHFVARLDMLGWYKV